MELITVNNTLKYFHTWSLVCGFTCRNIQSWQKVL